MWAKFGAVSRLSLGVTYLTKKVTALQQNHIFITKILKFFKGWYIPVDGDRWVMSHQQELVHVHLRATFGAVSRFSLGVGKFDPQHYHKNHVFY